MENFVKRLIVEHKELCDKTNKLDAFIKSKKSDEIERGELLTIASQFSTMTTYINLLENRLAFHNIEVKDGLYKKIITQEDFMEDVEFDN